MTSRRAVPVACATALLAAACGSGAGSLGSLYEFRGEDCGAVSTGHDWAVPASASECVLDAWRSGEPAHLRATGPTVEGDPITRGFQVTGQRTYDYVYDAREDSFGTKEVRLFHCEEFVGAVTDLQPSFAGARSCQPKDGQQLAG
jgi:hypothetical protein